MKKSKLFIYSLILSMLFTFIPQNVQAAVSVSADSAILIEQETGRILYEKNPHKVKRIASITKIMTAILAIESGMLEETVKVSENAAGAEGSSLYLKPNERIKLKDLVYGLMLRSGNDAAVAIAEHVGGSLDGFVYLMNEKAQHIGMANTHFANPHGLDDHENHHSSAYDMAILTKYAMMNDEYVKISGTKVHRAPNPGEKWDRIWRNKNRLLTELYEYCTGGKTGYTKRAKRTLVTTATKGDMNLIAVTLNGPDDWKDHIYMYENAFQSYDMAQVLEKGSINEVKDKFYRGKVYLNKTYSYPVTSKEKELFSIEYKMVKPKKSWKKGKKVPEVVGKAIVYFEQEPIRELPIYFGKEDKETALFEYFRSLFTSIIGVKSDG